MAMNRLDEDQLRNVQSELVVAATALKNGQIGFVDGVRRILRLGSVASPQDHDPDFMLFVGIDSTSDHLPGLDQRPHCSAAWLEQCDKEAHELEAHWAAEVHAACDVLMARYSV